MPPKKSSQAEQKESSVLFSLKELMTLEEERIRAEEAEREAQARLEAERRAAEERARREEEERRIREEEEARRLEEQRRREEAARLEAIQRAELEKARAEAEQKARLAQIAAQQAHELSLAELRQDKTKKRATFAAIGLGVVVVVGGIAVYAVMSARAEEMRKREAALVQQRLAAEQKLAELQRDFEDKRRKEQALEEALKSAKDEKDRIQIQNELEKAKRAREAAGRAVGGARRESGASKPGCNCPPGDPLCSCL